MRVELGLCLLLARELAAFPYQDKPVCGEMLCALDSVAIADVPGLLRANSTALPLSSLTQIDLSPPIRSTVAKSRTGRGFPVSGGEADAVTVGQLAVLLAVNGAFTGLSSELGRVVGDLFPLTRLNGKDVLVAVNRKHRDCAVVWIPIVYRANGLVVISSPGW